MRFLIDSTKTLNTVFDKVRSKYFSADPVMFATIQYVFWEGEKRTSDGRIVRGETRIPSLRERDIYGIDFIISIDKDYWVREASTRDKIRLAYHELKHCIVIAKTKKGKWVPKQDKEGRLKIKIRPHDVNLNIFLDEITTVGLSENENAYIYELESAVRNSDEESGESYESSRRA